MDTAVLNLVVQNTTFNNKIDLNLAKFTNLKFQHNLLINIVHSGGPVYE